MKHLFSPLLPSDNSPQTFLNRLEKQYSLQWQQLENRNVQVAVQSAFVSEQTVGVLLFPHIETCQWLCLYIYGISQVIQFKARLDFGNSTRDRPFKSTLILFKQGKRIVREF
jgi:hypothetical protein